MLLSIVMRCSLLAVVAVVLLLPSSAEGRDKKYALLVGVETYDPQFFTQLKYAERDAQELGRALQTLNYEVIVMTSQARIPAHKPNTAEKILDLLQRRLGTLDEDDTLIVSFSGHGVQFKDDALLADGSRETYFCPEEANLRDRSTLVPLSEVYQQMAASKAQRKLLLIDACRNEVLSETARTSGREVELDPVGRNPRTVPRGTLALFSCASSQKSFEHPELEHGVFCYHVLKYLRGDADSRYYRRQQLKLDDLVYFVRRETHDFALGRLNADQRPELVGRSTDWSLGELVPKELVNSIEMELVLIPPGEFRRGTAQQEIDRLLEEECADEPSVLRELVLSEGPQRRVRITRAFYLGAHEVTVGQFRKFVEATEYRTEAEQDGRGGLGWNETSGEFEGPDPKYTWRNPGFVQRDDHPVVNVSWNDAVAFCEWLSQREAVQYRLPTEAEWEYACRAGTTTRYYSGDDPESLTRVGNVLDATAKAKLTNYQDWDYLSGRDGYAFTAPVGQFAANAFGLYDMHGNVWEWCGDWYDKDYYGKSPLNDPMGPSEAACRVVRGGGWRSVAGRCRAAVRSRGGSRGRFDFLGFRVAAVPASKSSQ